MKIEIDTLDIDWFERDFGAMTKKINGELLKITFEVIKDEQRRSITLENYKGYIKRSKRYSKQRFKTWDSKRIL